MRKAAQDQLHTIRRLRRLLRSNRTVIGLRLAADPEPGSAERRLFVSLFAFLHDQLQTYENDLWQVESLYSVAQEHAAAARRDRDRAASDLQAVHTPVYRQLARHRLGERFGITGRAPDTPPLLARRVPVTLGLLRQMGDDPPPIGGVKLEPAVLAANLDAGLQTLEDAVTALDNANSDARFARQQANGELSHAARMTPPVGRMLEALGELAGRQRFAAEVRKCFA